MMGVFNNLVVYDQAVKQNTLETIVPDLATGWSWNEDATELTLPLHRGVKWHDGKPFTAQDVKCTWDLLTGKGDDKLRVNPRKSWYHNLVEVTSNGDYEIAFRLKRPQPAFLALLASGFSPIYPCHVPAREMRSRPIGTGPFKFVEFKPNEHIKVTRNPDYWKPARPYLDGIEYTIIKNASTAILAFAAGKVDMTFPYSVTQPLLNDVKGRMPHALCETSSLGLYRSLIVNREKPPFDNADLRRAMALSLDRKSFIDTITEGQGDIGGVMQPPPEGQWGMTPEMLQELPGYDPDVQKNRAEAQQLMQRLGYGPDNRLKVKVTVRDLPYLRDQPAVIITRAQAHPGLVALAGDEGLAGLALRLQRIEFLLQPLLGGFAGVDRTADGSLPTRAVGRGPRHWPAEAGEEAGARFVRPKNRGPDQCASVIRSAIAVSDR